MIDLTKPALGIARWIWCLIIIAVVIGASWWIVTSLIGGKVAKVEAKLGQAQTEAALESGADAVASVGQTQVNDAATDTITRENDRAIRQAPGADAPVDPAARNAGLRSVCRRAAYRQRPECLQHAPAR
jgi:hypothetical protein